MERASLFLISPGRKGLSRANQIEKREAEIIIVMGYVHLDPSDVDEFLADIHVIAPGTRAEKGCLFYAVTLDDAHAGRMLVVEQWQDQESLTVHLEGATGGGVSEVDEQNQDRRSKIRGLKRTTAHGLTEKWIPSPMGGRWSSMMLQTSR
jgi:quinol monooxygenase YgiN